MNKEQTCTFAGHSMFIPDELFPVLFNIIEDFILTRGESVFLVGGMGEFDEMCARAVKEVKRKFRKKNIKLCLVYPYMRHSLNKDRLRLQALYDEII